MFQDGQEVIEFIDELLNEIPARSLDTNHLPQQPVALILLDIQMPILTGLETLTLIKKKFATFEESRLMRPMICYLSQLGYTPMSFFIT